jgi:methylmalonyl-CoA/ethylmalonyl-CoA epimerase
MQHSTPKGNRIAHVGIALRSLGDATPFFREILGLEQVEINDSDGAKISAFTVGESLVELLEPDDAESPIGKFIEKRGPGIHHICFAVDDLDGMLERCRSAGIQMIDSVPRMGADGKRIAFLHPRSTGGILIELSE